jgi:hypothetical protein
MYARYFDQTPAFEFLHDLRADPDQLQDFATDAAHADELRMMRALCDAEMNARGGPLLPMGERGARKSENARKAAKKARD